MRKWIWAVSALAYALIAFVFIQQLHGTAIGYFAYLLSAAALVADLAIIIPKVIRWTRSQMMKTTLGGRFLTDFAFKQRLTLFFSFGMNTAYALMNLFNGVRNRSAWAISFAVYYLALGGMRLALFRSLRKEDYGRNLKSESRSYYRCGIAVMLMGIPFAGIVTLMVRSHMGYHYSQFIIYAMAAYVFYAVITCVINIIRFRKYKSPVLSAVKRVSFVSALVSLVGLQTAMLERFNTDEAFRFTMISRTGIVILLLIIITGAEMVIRGRNWMKQSSISN